MLDINLFQIDKGGNPDLIRESQKRRGADIEIVDKIIEDYKQWTKTNYTLDQLRRELNATQKDIGMMMKNKQDASELLAKKTEIEQRISSLKDEANTQDQTLRAKLLTIGNLVDKSVPTSLTEDDNQLIRNWVPEGVEVKKREDFISHHEVLTRIAGFDQDRGVKVAGHRGYFLTDDGVDFNLALIQYGLDFLKKRNYKKVQTPFFMRKEIMAKTAQLEEFDEALYKVSGDTDDKYLIATSEQPISALHSDEWFEKPKEQLPIKYAGYSTCFRKEAGSHGKDTWGIFRVHQFEKIEQFCITEPEKSWEMFDEMITISEEFYKSLKVPYQIVAIASGALNNAAAKKYDLEAWFPFQGEYKELVSCSNCTDYQSRRLEIRCGIKKMNEREKKYVHCLNSTLCATERALCCILENYQTAEGVVVPEVLRPYMQGRDFLPYVRELPKGTTSQKRK